MTERSKARSRLVTTLRWGSLAAALVALVYVGRVLAANWHSAQVDWANVSVHGLAIAVPCAVGALLVGSLTWHWLLRQLGSSVSHTGALSAWFTGNLYKYIPGQVWMAVGRTVKGAQAGVPVRMTLGTTVVEQGFSLLASGLILGVARGWVGLTFVCAALVALLLYPRGANAAVALVGRVCGRDLPSIPLSTGQLAVLFAASLLSALLGIAVMIGVIVGIGVFQAAGIREYTAASTAAFLSGYLFFGAPAGLGVREGTLLLLLQGEAGLSQGEASLVAVLTRLVIVISELVCFLAVALLAWLRHSPALRDGPPEPDTSPDRRRNGCCRG